MCFKAVMKTTALPKRVNHTFSDDALRALGWRLTKLRAVNPTATIQDAINSALTAGRAAKKKVQRSAVNKD